MSGIAGKLGVACIACALLMMGAPSAAQTHDVLKNDATAQAFLDALTPARHGRLKWRRNRPAVPF